MTPQLVARSTPCELCGAIGPCILRQSGDRYVWTCVDGCPPKEGD